MTKGHIYFKDKSGDEKGPFTEREVQEWYREGWFDSQYVFYFSNDLSIDSDSIEYTLEDLRSINGYGCPFMTIRNSQSISNNQVIDSGTDYYIQKMKEDLEELQMKCESMQKVEMRLKNIEDQLKDNVVEQKMTDDNSYKYKRMSKKKRDKLKKEETLDTVHGILASWPMVPMMNISYPQKPDLDRFVNGRNLFITTCRCLLEFLFRPSLIIPRCIRLWEKQKYYDYGFSFLANASSRAFLEQVYADIQTGLPCCTMCEWATTDDRIDQFYEHFTSMRHVLQLEMKSDTEEGRGYRILTMLIMKNGRPDFTTGRLPPILSDE